MMVADMRMPQAFLYLNKALEKCISKNDSYFDLNKI